MDRLLLIFSILLVLPSVVIAQEEEDAITRPVADSETTDQWRHIVPPITPVHEHNGYAGGSGRFDYNDAFDHDDETIDSPNYHSLDIEENKLRMSSDFADEILAEHQIAFEQTQKVDYYVSHHHGTDSSNYSDNLTYKKQSSSNDLVRRKYSSGREGYFYP